MRNGILPEQVIVDIINYEMQMPKDTVFIRDQNFKFNNAGNLNIVVGNVNSQFIGAATFMNEDLEQDPPQIQEIQETISREDFQIDFMAIDKSAIMRRWEIITALKSFYSQQQQEVNYFRIFALPNGFTNTSEAEGGSTLMRFTLIISCHVWYRKEKILELPAGDYYDDFKTRVDDQQSIGTDTGIVEFEITSGGIT